MGGEEFVAGMWVEGPWGGALAQTCIPCAKYKGVSLWILLSLTTAEKHEEL